MNCAWTVAVLGPDGSSRVDLVTRDLDVYRINAVVESLRQDLELVEVRKSLEFAEIHVRLQDAEVELVKLRQSVPKSPSESLVLRSGERWLVLEMLPEVDLSLQGSSAGVHGDLGVRDKMSRKRADRRSRLNRPLTTQQIADFKDQLFNRARAKDMKGNEQ